MRELDCSDAWGHHSDDRVNVYRGSTTPLYMCGRHAYATTETTVTREEIAS